MEEARTTCTYEHRSSAVPTQKTETPSINTVEPTDMIENRDLQMGQRNLTMTSKESKQLLNRDSKNLKREPQGNANSEHHFFNFRRVIDNRSETQGKRTQPTAESARSLCKNEPLQALTLLHPI